MKTYRVFLLFFQFIFRVLSLLSDLQLLHFSSGISITCQNYWHLHMIIKKRSVLFSLVLKPQELQAKLFLQLGVFLCFYKAFIAQWLNLRTKYLDNLVKTCELRNHSKNVLWMVLGYSASINVRVKFWLLNLSLYHIYHKNVKLYYVV